MAKLFYVYFFHLHFAICWKHSVSNQYIPVLGILIHVSTAKSICNEGLDYS